MKNKLNLIFGTIFVVLISMSFVNAAGIVSPYWKDRPLEMNFGETIVINFNFQNPLGDEDATVKVEILEGTDIANLEQDTYTAKAGTHDKMIPVTITIPKDYNKGVQKIKIEFLTVPTREEAGMVTLGTGYITEFNVILSEKPISRSVLIGIIIAIIAVLILLVLIILFLLLRKK